jgi:hypothetical protein
MYWLSNLTPCRTSWPVKLTSLGLKQTRNVTIEVKAVRCVMRTPGTVGVPLSHRQAVTGLLTHATQQPNARIEHTFKNNRNLCMASGYSFSPASMLALICENLLLLFPWWRIIHIAEKPQTTFTCSAVVEEISYRPRQKSTPEGPTLASNERENSLVTLKMLTVALSNKALYYNREL